MKKIGLIILILAAALVQPWADEALTITSNGNVGINTTEPQAQLEVAGDVKVSGNVVTSNVVSTQLDYIYAGSQVIVDYWNQVVGTTAVTIAKSFDGGLLNAPLIPNPDSQNYQMLYYISFVQSDNSNPMSYVIFSINNIDLNSARTISDSTYRYMFKTGFFQSWVQFGTNVPVDGYGGAGLNIRVRSGGPANSDARITGVTVHYVYVRRGVDYPKINGLAYTPFE